MKLKKINHIGIVVKDIAEAKERYGKLFGIKNWYEIVCDGALDLEYLGEKKNCRVTLYYGGKGTAKLELIETHGDYNIYDKFYEKNGERMHHIMYNVKDLDAAVAECEKSGMKVWQRANFTSGGQRIRYAYVGAAEDALIMELVETTMLFGIKKGDLPLEIKLGTLTGSFKKIK
jgi:Glyoxalase/Bleomycin resistance protein/Dioxygenase superfamily.